MHYPVYWFTLHCPHCRTHVDMRLFGITSMLGQPDVKCRKCKAVFESGRYEWVDLYVNHKVFYVIVSAVYAAFAGFLGGFMTMLWYNYGVHGREQFPPSPDAAFYVGAVIWAVGVLGLQAWRVCRSVRRTSCNAESVPETSFWNLDSDLQLKLLGLCLFAFAFIFVIRLAVFSIAG